MADINRCSFLTAIEELPNITYTQDTGTSRVSIAVTSTDDQDMILYTDYNFGDGTRYLITKDVDSFHISHIY